MMEFTRVGDDFLIPMAFARRGIDFRFPLERDMDPAGAVGTRSKSTGVEVAGEERVL